MPRVPTKEPEHVHSWNGTVCFNCGAISMTYPEFLKQRNEWYQYYDIVKTTEAYANFKAMLAAIKEKSPEKIKVCRDKAQSLLDEHVWLPQPEFPDPMVLRSQRKLVIIE